MATDRHKRTPVTTIPVVVLVLVVALVAGLFVWLVAGRVTYPFELEWMEGAMADHVCRVLEGKRIYTEPSYEHVAFLYHPGYFYVAALVGLLTGPGSALLALRVVSLLATFGSCVFVFRLARRDGQMLGGIAAVGVFLAAFSLTGCYYDVGRVDPLFTCLLLWGIDATRSARSWRGLAYALAVFLAAWLTKQTALVILPFVVIGCMSSGFGRAVSFGALLAAVCGLAVWILDIVHDGWMSYFTLELPRHHGILPRFYTAYWTHDMLPLIPALALTAWFLLEQRAALPEPAPAAWIGSPGRAAHYHGAWIFGCVLGSYLSRLHIGGAANVLIPVVAALSVGCGLGLGRLDSGTPAVLTVTISTAVAQIAVLLVLPWFGRAIPVVPSPAMRARAVAFIDEIRGLPGPVFLPWHGHVARLAGKPPTAHSMAMDDVWRSGDDRAVRALNESLKRRLDREPYPTVYVDDVGHGQLRQMLLGSHYLPVRMIGDADARIKPPVGAPLFPRVVLRR